jgi:hypothetical protein
MGQDIGDCEGLCFRGNEWIIEFEALAREQKNHSTIG